MENKNMTVQETIDRISKLNEARQLVNRKINEFETHEKDLKAQEVVNGIDSNEYKVKKELLDNAKQELADAEKQVKELSFKKSELKPVFDEVAKKFEDELRAEQEREFHVEIGPTIDLQNEGEELTVEKAEEVRKYQKAGRKAFKSLLEYLYKDVNWSAKTAPGLLVLVRNMEENKPWVQSHEFNNVIKLRSSNVLVLWRSVLEDMTGKGFYEAKSFLECWANCGKGISDAVREIQKLHEEVRNIGTQLNTIEDEYNNSENDIVGVETLTTQEEVNPEV